jgi:hypothetical protein
VSDYGFYDAGALRQVATNLLYGWGYNFYRIENQLRADDRLVRCLVSRWAASRWPRANIGASSFPLPPGR